MASKDSNDQGDLSVTALYTSQVWIWGQLPCATLYATPEARVIFGVVNLVLLVTRLFKWRLRSLRHSLLHRHVMLDELLRRSGTSEVLELACGLSRRGAFFSENDAINYTEVDLAAVIEKKRALLETSTAGKAVLARPNLTLLAADVTQINLSDCVTGDNNLFVVSEGLLMYLQPDQQRVLWRRIATLLSGNGGGTYTFDLVPWVEQPKPGLLGRMLERLMKVFTRGRSFERDQRTRQDVATDLQAAGFAHVSMLEPGDVLDPWCLPFPETPTQQLIFVCKV